MQLAEHDDCTDHWANLMKEIALKTKGLNKDFIYISGVDIMAGRPMDAGDPDMDLMG